MKPRTKPSSQEGRAALAANVDRVMDKVTERVADKLDEVKPVLRGWIHAGMIPVLTAAFAVLIVLSPTTLTRVGSSVYAGSALLLFSVSGLYHRGNWQPRLLLFWRRFDHANIYIFIAGTYTPFAFLYLHGATRWWMFGIVWGCALAGAVFKILMPGAPRWLSTPLYIAMGWVAIGFLPEIIAGSHHYPTWMNISCLVLVATGGLLYTIGGVVYGTKWPNPSPRVFGFHEVFHSFTAAAFVVQYIAVSFATYELR